MNHARSGKADHKKEIGGEIEKQGEMEKKLDGKEEDPITRSKSRVFTKFLGI